MTTSAADRAARLALLHLPDLGPARFEALVARTGSPSAAWDAVVADRLDGIDLRRGGDGRRRLVASWVRAARRTDPDQLLARHREAGVEVLAPGDPGWPLALAHDPEPPALLFVQGDLGLLGRRGVAVVGTRRCTAAGAQVARHLGAGLADAGVPVVSGLALGIDGAAHRGALDAGGAAIGVVGCGLDIVYPPRNRELWSRVADQGVLVSEAPLGVAPERWRFPARNRLIAALSCAVVVVESRLRGGSMTTVEQAQDRGIDVLAVPGSVLAEQSAGTNRLLTEGAGVVRDASDVLAAIGSLGVVPQAHGGRVPADEDDDAEPDLADDPLGAVLVALSPTPAGVEQVAAAAGVSVADAMTALARLEAQGSARRVAGGYEQVLGGGSR